jgi:hypothetical protein
MKTRDASVLLAIFGTAMAASAADLSWADVARRPELWPAQCAVKDAIKFEGGAGVQAGEEVNVVAFKASEVDVQTKDGKLDFAAQPDETDVLDVARAGYAVLTAKQQALTYPALAQKKELWPEKVALTRRIAFPDGKVLENGDQVLLKAVQPDHLQVVSEKLNARFNVVPGATDLMAQARTFVESSDGVSPRYLAEKAEQEKIRTEGQIVTQLQGRLVNSVTGQPEPLDEAALPHYLVFIRGSSTCSITRHFLPTLMSYYNETKPKHPEFEVIYIGAEEDADSEKFAKEMGFTWRALGYHSTAAVPSVHQTIDGLLPQLIVMDRNGRVLANGIQATAPAALQQLDALLKQSPAQN